MDRMLDKINSPESLKNLSTAELADLAAEIRAFLTESVNSTGGHLASNLGIVELTIALHREFNSPHDKFIWDVGHQSYTHKLLTGRRDMFRSLRQYGGISGFPDPVESDHDQFCTGHASTSISAAVGMAIARDLAGEDYDIVAIIGDGALTGGMAYEALNHAGNLGKKLIVVLADNGMSISPTVGALAKRLNRFRLDDKVTKAKSRTMRILSGSRLGKSIDWMIHRFTRSAKALIMPTMFFEELGFTYIGPVDGHNIAEIETALKQARSQTNKPAFVHVLTTKGKGNELAESSPVLYHSVPPPNGNGKPAISYSKVFAQTVSSLMEQNPRIVIITAAMAEGNSLESIAAKYPSRFFDVGICEEHAVTMAAGLASQGFIPVVAIYSTFLQRGFDQIIHDVALQDLPVVFAMDRSGIVGEDGKTHQGTFDLAYMRLIPNMIISAPKDENELQHLIATATVARHPMAVRYPRGDGFGVPLDAKIEKLEIGKGELLKKGSELALIAIGATVYPCIEAARELELKGISTAVVNARFVKPLDTELINEIASQTGRIVTVEENTLEGGFGSAVVEHVNAGPASGCKVRCIGIPDTFVEHGAPDLLRSIYKLDAAGIEQQVLGFFPELVSQPADRTAKR